MISPLLPVCCATETKLNTTAQVGRSKQKWAPRMLVTVHTQLTKILSRCFKEGKALHVHLRYVHAWNGVGCWNKRLVGQMDERTDVRQIDRQTDEPTMQLCNKLPLHISYICLVILPTFA